MNAVDDGHGGVNSFFTLYETCENECSADATRCVGPPTGRDLRSCSTTAACTGARAPARTQATTASTACGRPASSSPIVAEDGTVTFFLPAGDSTTMDVAGDFNDPSWSNLPMLLEDENWTLTVGPLAPGT